MELRINRVRIKCSRPVLRITSVNTAVLNQIILFMDCGREFGVLVHLKATQFTTSWEGAKVISKGVFTPSESNRDQRTKKRKHQRNFSLSLGVNGA